MRYLLATLQTLVVARFIQRWAFLCVWIAAVCSSVVAAGCGPGVSTANTEGSVADLNLVKEQLRPLCWEPPEVTAAKANGDEDIFFAFVTTTGEAVTSRDRWVLDQAIFQDGFVFNYDVDAPLENLRLVPLSRAADAWCTRIPRPTDEAALALLNPCSGAASTACKAPAPQNLLGQTVASPYSPFFCEKRPRMAPTTQEFISILQRNIAYMSAREQARKIAKALTQAEADMKSVLNHDRGWFKRAFTSDPGSIEQIQQRVADQLDSIEAAPDYDQCELDILSIEGFKDGFAEGKFDVQAKLFAIDASIFVLEVVALEIALGPLGGAKAIVSVVGKGAKVVTTVAGKGSQLLAYTSTKGGQALAAAMKRLEDLPIFIPGAAGGVGFVMKAGRAAKSMARYNTRMLEEAMFEEARILGKALKKLASDETHHIVAQAAKKAQGARDILAKFGININHPANGVFLPGSKLALNPNGAIVHAILANNTKYYERVEEALGRAKSTDDALRILRRIGETLADGTFFHARF